MEPKQVFTQCPGICVVVMSIQIIHHLHGTERERNALYDVHIVSVFAKTFKSILCVHNLLMFSSLWFEEELLFQVHWLRTFDMIRTCPV